MKNFVNLYRSGPGSASATPKVKLDKRDPDGWPIELSVAGALIGMNVAGAAALVVELNAAIAAAQAVRK